MVEFKVEDYFAGSGGAADDATDCTDALQAAVDAAYAVNGGIIRFPREGICRIEGSITKSFFGHEGTLIFTGGAVRFVESGTQRISINTLNFMIWEDIVILGSNDEGNEYEATNSHLYFTSVHQTIFNRVSLFGLAIASTTRGVVFADGHLMVSNCNISGCSVANSGVFRTEGFGSAHYENIVAYDYVAYKGESFSKTPFGLHSWIYAKDSAQTNANGRSVVTVKNCSFDEGASLGVYVEDVVSVNLEGTANNCGSGNGFHFKDIDKVHVKNTWAGYSGSSPEKKGLILENVKNTEIDHLTLANNVRVVELLGTTKKVSFRDSFLNGSTYPNGIKNDANALIVIDGVKTRNGITDYR